MAVEDLEAWTQLDLDCAVAGECCAPGHDSKFFRKLAKKRKLRKRIICVVLEEFHSCIWEEVIEN